MGKNQTHKAMQASRGGAEAEGAPDDGKVDGTWHSPEWHAARVKELLTPRVSWDEYRSKKKEEEAKEQQKMMEQEELEKEYLRQVALDRERKLSKVSQQLKQLTGASN